MNKLQKAQQELDTALLKFKEFEEQIKNKEILYNNTPEEIEEIVDEMKREIIMPLLANVIWLKNYNAIISKCNMVKTYPPINS